MKTITILCLTLFLSLYCSAGGVILIDREESVERVKNNVMEFWRDQRDLIPVVSKQIPLTKEQVTRLENSKTWIATDFRASKKTFIEDLNATLAYKRENATKLRGLIGEEAFKRFSNGLVLLKTLIHMIPVEPLRVITYEGIRAEGGFNAKSLRNVSRIIPSGDALTAEEIEQLVTSQILTKLHSLDLSGQKNINDEAIHRLCLNGAFSRMINLDLSHTPITNVSIKALLSGHMGSIRDLPQVSARFGVPATTVYLTARDTGIQPALFTQDFKDEFFGGGTCVTFFSSEFHIDYFNPITEEKTSPPVDGAMKMIEVTMR